MLAISVNNLYTLYMHAHTAAYSKKQIIQFLAVFWACALFCAVTVFLTGEAGTPPPNNIAGMYATIVGLAVVLPLLLLVDVKVRRIRKTLFTVAHIVGGMALVFYLGAYNPISVAWVILCIVTYMEFGFKAYLLSSATLYVSNIVFYVLLTYRLPSDYPLVEYIFYSMISATALVLSALVLTRIIDSANKRRQQIEQLRKSEVLQMSRLNTLLNSLSDAVLTLNHYGRITSQNAAALSFFDTNESLVGKSIDSILTLQDSAMKPLSPRALMETVKSTLFRDDVSTVQADESIARLSIQMSRIHGTFEDKAEHGVVLIIRDITKQKTLEDEKDEFISVTSHELRTPIAIAEGSLSNLVLMQAKGMDPAKLASAASTAHDQVLYLARMINDLSTLSRAERGVGDVEEEIDVKQLFHDLYTRYQPEAQVKALQLNLDLDSTLPSITTSRLYLEEILQNFITNAIKYTEKGTITLQAHMVEGQIECLVSDTGIGISKTDQKKVFDKFFRSEDYRTRETNGTGLGLYVVAKLAAKLDTKVEVRSRLNHGTTFSFILPQRSHRLGTGKRTSV
jgi:two-component system, OmpR family, phosphate regulon sensor histidine kinase PhoR